MKKLLSIAAILGMMFISESARAAAYTASTAAELATALDNAHGTAEPDTITLTASFTVSADCSGYVLVNIACAAGNAMPNVSDVSGITINGGGYTIRSNGGFFRLFRVAGGNLTLNNMTITGFSPGASIEAGAILLTMAATLNVDGVTFSLNQGEGGFGGGGAIYANDFTANTITITNSVFSGNNVVDGNGGAIVATTNSTLNVSTSTFINNTADASGGAIYATGTLTVTNSGFSGNEAQLFSQGGAIYAQGDTTITSSSFSGNTATDGGALFGVSGTFFNVLNSTIAGNSATNTGGGVRNGFGIMSLTNTIIANNTATTSGPDCADDTDITSNGNNLIEDTSGCSMAPLGSDITGTDPNLRVSFSNTGIAGEAFWGLGSGSAAINTGSAGACPATDQIGNARIGTCDIGAVELMVCGDSNINSEIGEACDDGNVVNTDACTGTCQNAACSDGFVQAINGEQCDDSNIVSGDGCDNLCQNESTASTITVNSATCSSAAVADTSLTLGEAILLANGTLARGALSVSEQALVPLAVGAGSDTITFTTSTLTANCTLPTITAASLTINGGSDGVTLTSSALGSTASVLNIGATATSTTIKNITFNGSGGIAINSAASGTVVQTNTFDGYDIGVKPDDSAIVGGTSAALGNNFTSNNIGVLLQNVSTATVRNNSMGITNGILALSNVCGVVVSGVTGGSFFDNTISASTDVGLLASEGSSLNIYRNIIGPNENFDFDNPNSASPPLGATGIQGTGALFQVQSSSTLCGGLVPDASIGASVSGNVGDDTTANMNAFAFNDDNLIMDGATVSMTIGLNSFANTTNGYYRIRNSANTSGGTEVLAVPVCTLVSSEATDIASDSTAGTYTFGMSCTADAGATVRIYATERASETSALIKGVFTDSTSLVDEGETDIMGNYDTTFTMDLDEGVNFVDFSAKACMSGCAVDSGLSTSDPNTKVNIRNLVNGEGELLHGAPASGGGCSLNLVTYRNSSSTSVFFLMILIPLIFRFRIQSQRE